MVPISRDRATVIASLVLIFLGVAMFIVASIPKAQAALTNPVIGGTIGATIFFLALTISKKIAHN